MVVNHRFKKEIDSVFPKKKRSIQNLRPCSWLLLWFYAVCSPRLPSDPRCFTNNWCPCTESDTFLGFCHPPNYTSFPIRDQKNRKKKKKGGRERLTFEFPNWVWGQMKLKFDQIQFMRGHVSIHIDRSFLPMILLLGEFWPCPKKFGNPILTRTVWKKIRKWACTVHG